MKTIKMICFLGFLSSSIFAQNQPADLAPIADATIYQGDNTRNYGAESKLLVKNKKGSTISRRSFLQFDLSTLANFQVKKATLKLYVNAIEFAEDVSSGMVKLDLSTLENSWEEASVDWKTGPKPGIKLVSAEIKDKKTWVEFDLTDYVKSLAPGTKTISIALTNSEGTGTLVEFSSREGKNKPVLSLQ